MPPSSPTHTASKCTARTAGSDRRRPGQGLRHVGVALEQDIATFRVSVTRFVQNVDGQLATVFDPSLAKGQRRADLSHYGVASVGDFNAAGWAVGISRPVGTHLR